MILLKDLAITTMYLYIFVVALQARETAAVFLLLLLGINYSILRKKCFNFNNKLKECLISQRESFVNILSHDLRIPAIAQIRALELVKNEKLGALNNTQKNMLIDIEDSCKCILNLMSLTINTYSMENNRYKFIYEKFNLSDVILFAFNELLHLASEKNITFEYENKYKNLQILGDKEELKKVIINILFSSISNANFGQKILIKIIHKNNKIRMTVTVKDDNCKYTNTAINSSYTSIGQNIRMGFCKKIIESHKGKVIENNRKNTFTFEIPQACVN